MSTLYVDNLEPNLGSRVMAAGHVVQVVSSESSTEIQNFTSGVWVDTANSVSITPTAASSTVLVSFTAGGLVNNTQYVGIRILRDSTVVAKNWTYHNNDDQWDGVLNFSIQGHDSPSTTSAVTYKVQIFCTQNPNHFYFNYDGPDDGIASLIAMEIAQ